MGADAMCDDAGRREQYGQCAGDAVMTNNPNWAHDLSSYGTAWRNRLEKLKRPAEAGLEARTEGPDLCDRLATALRQTQAGQSKT